MVRNYNDFMGGVDGSDQMLQQYLDDRKTNKFWKKVTFNIFGRMIINSYVLYKLNTKKPLSHLEYTVSIIEDLSTEWLIQQEGIPNLVETSHLNQRGRRSQGGGGGATSISEKYFEKIPDKREKNCCVCSAASTKAVGKRKKQHLCARNAKKVCIPSASRFISANIIFLVFYGVYS